jgi:aspartyl-tRNA(Asn)/glutamyl-tRNA(Gln) amidotransferase subunit A
LDQIGPFGTCVSDVEEVYKVITGHDVLDSTSLPENLRNKRQEIKIKKVIGVPRSFINREGIDKDVLENFTISLKKLEDVGYTLKDVTIEHLEKALSVYYILMPAEVSSNLARYDGIRFGLSHPGETSIQSYFESRTAGFGPAHKILTL